MECRRVNDVNFGDIFQEISDVGTYQRCYAGSSITMRFEFEKKKNMNLSLRNKETVDSRIIN